MTKTLAEDRWDEPADGFWSDAEPVRDGAFDAFDSNSWYFEPAPAPWYRGKQALIALIAATTAAAALVVAAVLLVFRSPADVEDATTLGHRNRADDRGVDRARHQQPAAATAATAAAAATSAAPAGPEPAETIRPPQPVAAVHQTARDRGDSHSGHTVTHQRRAAAAGTCALTDESGGRLSPPA